LPHMSWFKSHKEGGAPDPVAAGEDSEEA